MVIDPRGTVVVETGNREWMISADLDLSALLRYRREFSVLLDIHADYVKVEE